MNRNDKLDRPAEPISATHALPASTASARLARRHTRAALAGFPDSVIEVAELLVSELVANAVRHTGSAPIMHIDVAAGGIHVDVADHSPATPDIQHPVGEASGGRGLMLVDALAASWGWSKTPQGKRVWFTL